MRATRSIIDLDTDENAFNFDNVNLLTQVLAEHKAAYEAATPQRLSQNLSKRWSALSRLPQVEAEGQAEKQLGQEVARELSEVQLERVSEAEQSAMHLESVLDDLAAAKVTLERADESEGIALRQLAEFKQTSAEQIDKLTQALQKVTSDVRRSKLKREELLKLSLAEGPLEGMEEAQEILDLKQQLQELSETKLAIRQLPTLLAQAQAAHDVRVTATKDKGGAGGGGGGGGGGKREESMLNHDIHTGGGEGLSRTASTASGRIQQNPRGGGSPPSKGPAQNTAGAGADDKPSASPAKAKVPAKKKK